MSHCFYCGIEHKDIPTDLAYRRPVHYFLVPEEERKIRCLENDDLCVIDGGQFLVRGIMEIPILDQKGIFLTWGLWASISQTNFDRYYELRDEDASKEPSFNGLLAVSPNGYPKLHDKKVDIQLRSATERPLFTPKNYDHPLFIEHRDGITTQRWHEVVFTAMPWLKNSE